MLSSPVTGLDSFVAAAVIIVLLIFLVTLFIITRSIVRKPDDNNSQHLQTELAELKKRVSTLEAQIDSRSSTAEDGAPEDPLYSIALRLIKDGLPFDEVAARVGISRAEVELIQVLNQESGRTQQSAGKPMFE